MTQEKTRIDEVMFVPEWQSDALVECEAEAQIGEDSYEVVDTLEALGIEDEG